MILLGHDETLTYHNFLIAERVIEVAVLQFTNFSQIIFLEFQAFPERIKSRLQSTPEDDMIMRRFVPLEVHLN